jgi:hypothetical protein
MRYVCLGFHDETAWNAIPVDQRQQLLDDTFAYEKVLRAEGRVLDSKGLQTARSAATLRFAGGKPTITDGPFAETKEQLGGFMLVEAHDMNHAIQLMSKIPCMRMGGTIEIRPLNEELST